MSALNRWLDESIARRITVLVTALLLAVGFAVSALSYLQVLRVTQHVTAERLEALSDQLVSLLARSPLDIATKLSRLATDSAIEASLASGRLDPKAAEALRKAAGPDARMVVVLVDTAGNPLEETGAAPASRWFGPPAGPARGAPRVGPYRRFADTLLFFDVRIPVRRDGAVVGGVLQRSRLTLSTASRSTFSWLLGNSASIRVGSPTTGAWTDLGEVVPPPPPEALQPGMISHYSVEGIEYLGFEQTIPGTATSVIVQAPRAAVVAPARAYLGSAVLLALGAVLLGTLGAAGLGRRLSRPVEEITEVSERIASEESTERADERAPGEIGRLGRSFNAMVERVAQSTRRLRENEGSHRAFVSHASQGIWRVELIPAVSRALSPEQQIETWYRMAPLVECNAALARMHGVEGTSELMNLPLDRLFPREDPAARQILVRFIESYYRGSEVESREAREGESPRVFVNDLIGVLENGAVRRIWGTRRDVTLERLLDARLAQTQRLEAIGRLAGGVAHDFNNLLTAILGYADSMKEHLPAEEPARQDAEEIAALGLRASELTRHLLAFSRGQVMRPAALDLNAVARSTEGLLRRVIGEDIDFKLALAEKLEAIEADAGQIERVLMNLVVNARDAMPHGGTLELRTAIVELDAEYAHTRPGIAAGRYVMLAVSDSGVGMSEEVRQHVFEPFFTTKPKGSGTGLGLSTVYGIVRQSGGDITVYSEPGRGSTFKTFFPVRVKGAALAAEIKLSQVPADHSGSETILLVEDEASVREIVRRALTAAGYSVLVARDGPEALELGDGKGGGIDLVLSDMILPGMTGRDLVAEFRKRDPGLRVIIMSGYTGETYPALEALPAGVGYLEKPFSLADLRKRVREALDRPGSAS